MKNEIGGSHGRINKKRANPIDRLFSLEYNISELLWIHYWLT